MSLETSLAAFGRALDEFSVNLGSAVRRATRAMQLATAPHPTAEGRRLTEDLCRERYDLVERSDVRVERVPAESTDGDAAHVRYHDGSEWSDVTRYNLESIESALEDL